MFNENRSCIEIYLALEQALVLELFNENRSCIEMTGSNVVFVCNGV